MYGLDMSVAVKDSSEAMIVNNTIVDSASGLELYEKALGQDGGHAVSWNHILWNNANSIVLLHSSTLSAESRVRRFIRARAILT